MPNVIVKNEPIKTSLPKPPEASKIEAAPEKAPEVKAEEVKPAESTEPKKFNRNMVFGPKPSAEQPKVLITCKEDIEHKGMKAGETYAVPLDLAHQLIPHLKDC